MWYKLTMDTQSIINLGAGTILAVLGWLARQLWDAVKELRSDVHQIEVDLPRNYVQRTEFSDSIREIKDICDKIFDRIDKMEQRKADK